MTEVSLWCSRCGQSSKLTQDGKYIRCNTCGQAFIVPREKRGLFSKEPETFEQVTTGPCPALIESYESKIREKQSQVSEKDEQIGSLKGTIAALIEKNHQLEAKCQSLRDNRDYFEKRCEGLEKSIEDLQNQIAEKTHDIALLNEQLDENRSCISNLEDELKTTNESVNQLNSQLAEKDCELVENRKMVTRYQSLSKIFRRACDSKNKELVEKTDILSRSEAELTEVKEMFEQTQADLSEMQDRLRQEQDSVCSREEFEELKSDFQDRFNDKNETIDALRHRVEELKGELSDTNKDLTEIKSNLQVERERNERKLSQLKREYAKLSEENRALSSENNMLRNKQAVLNSDSSDRKPVKPSNKTREELIEENEQLRKFFLNQSLSTYKTAALAYHGLSSNAMGEVERITNEYEGKITELNQRIETTNNELFEIQNSYDELEADNESLKNSLDGLRRELSDADQKYNALKSEGTLPVRDIIDTMLECTSNMYSEVIDYDDEDLIKQCSGYLKYLKMRMRSLGMRILYHEPNKPWIMGMDEPSPSLITNYVDDPDLHYTVHETKKIGCAFTKNDDSVIEPIVEQLSINIYVGDEGEDFDS